MKDTNRFRTLIGVMVLSFAMMACGISVAAPEALPTALPPPAMLLATKVTTSLQPAKLELQQPTHVSSPLIVTSEEQILVELYKRANPAVVNIITYIAQGSVVVSSGVGSGFLYDANGNIVTNSHVVHGSDQLEVVFSDGLSEPAAIVGTDFHSDLAVIKVDNLPEGIQPLVLGNMDELAVGQTVVALGNPFSLGGTLTRGIISALGRNIPALTSFSIPQAIQTDAPINPGNSGGPLLNLKGEVIGVNAQIETGGESRSNSGVGFAIPVSILERVIPALLQDGSYQWSWLGVRGANLSSATRQAMNLSVERGAYISDIIQDGPAEKSGLHGSTNFVAVNRREVDIGGDVIVGIDGYEVKTFEELLMYIALETSPGQQVELSIIRDGQPQTVMLTLEPRPPDLVESVSP